MDIKVQHFEEEGASEDGVRKRRKVVPSPELESVEKTISTYKEGEFQSEAQRKLHDAQKSLHLSLKPEILKLCKILKFSDDAEGLVDEFLEYVMNNHHVSREPRTIFEAFQISLCWTVASMLKQKIDRKESVALAQQHLNFNCSKDEADSVYSRLRTLKRMFSNWTAKLKVMDSPSSNEQKLRSPSGLEVENKLASDGLPMSVEEVQKIFHKKLNKLIQKQQEEKNAIVRSFEEDKVCMEERKRAEISVIHSCFKNNTSMRMGKLKSLDISFAKEFEELKNQMHTHLKKLKVEQLAAKRNIEEREAQCIDAMKSLVVCELLGKRPSSEPDDHAGEVTLKSPQTNSSNDGVNNIAPVNVNPPSSGEQICNGLSVNVSEKDIQFGVPETIGSGNDLEKLVSRDGPLLEDEIPNTSAVRVSREVHLRVPGTIGSSAGLENLVSGSGPFSEEQILDTSAVSVSGEVNLGAPEAIGSSDGLENLVSGSGPLLIEQIPDTTAVSIPINEMQLRVLENASSGDGDAIGSDFITQMSLTELIPDTTMLTVPSGKDGLTVPDTYSDEVEDSQASEENGETQIETSNGTTGMNQQDRVRNAVNENSPLQALSRAQEDECALPSVSSGMQLGAVPPCDEQNATEEVEHAVSQQVEIEVSLASEENDERRAVTSNGTTVMNQQDRVDIVVNENSGLQELAQTNTSSVQPTITMINSHPMSSNQAHEDECTLPSISSGMQLGAVPPSDKQNPTEQVEHAVSQPVETAPSNQSGSKAMISDPAAQEHLSLTSNSPSSSNAFDSPSVREVSNLPSSEACTFHPAEELVANRPSMLTQPVSQASTSSLIQTNGMPIGASEMQFPDLRTSTASEFNNCPAQSVQAAPLIRPPFTPSLLLLESERLCKEFEQTHKGYEDKKLHRQSECDNEVAQTRLKYEIKQQEIDAEYLTKKKELRGKYNKVRMNIILAYAYSFKSMELRSSDPSGTQQEVLVTSIRQLIEPLMQEHTRRISSVAGTSNTTSSAAASLQTLAPEPNLQATLPAQIIGSRTTLPPPVQGVSPPSAFFPSASARAPQIGSLSFSNRNQGSAQIRAPAPHLRSSASRGWPAFPNI